MTNGHTNPVQGRGRLRWLGAKTWMPKRKERRLHFPPPSPSLLSSRHLGPKNPARGRGGEERSKSMDSKKRWKRKKEKGAGLFWFPVLKMQMSITKNNFPFMFCVNKEGGQEEIPFPLPPLLPSLLVTNGHTHPVRGGREAVAADRSESAEWKRRKEGGERINFPLYRFVLYRGHPICRNEIFPCVK